MTSTTTTTRPGRSFKLKQKIMGKALHIPYILYRNVQMCADHADLYGFQFLSLVFLHRHGSASTCSGW
jgi:hypothetical protein